MISPKVHRGTEAPLPDHRNAPAGPADGDSLISAWQAPESRDYSQALGLQDDQLRIRIGPFGASQATWYMPVVAQATPEVRFMVVITGGVGPVGFQNRFEELTRLDGLSQAEAEAELGLLSDFDRPLGFNAIPILEALDIPLLYLLGGSDSYGPRRANLVATRLIGARCAAGLTQATVAARLGKPQLVLSDLRSRIGPDRASPTIGLFTLQPARKRRAG